MEIFGARPPMTSLPAARAACTPGCSSASCWNERPLRGRSRISFSPTSPLTAPDVRLTRETSPATTTSSLIFPISRATLTTAYWPTVSRMPRRSTVWNPVTATLTSYSPGGRSGAWYRPLASVTSSRMSPVPVLRTVTCAPWTAWPLESVIRPWMLAATFWARTGIATTSPATSMEPYTTPRVFMEASLSTPYGSALGLNVRPAHRKSHGVRRLVANQLQASACISALNSWGVS